MASSTYWFRFIMRSGGSADSRGDHKVNWPEVTSEWTKLTVDLIGVLPL